MVDGRSAGGVRSVERVFDLLSIITASGGESSLSELASRAELPLPTIHRLLRTLIPLGYVRQLPNRSYALGPGLIRLGNAAGLQLGTYAQPVLQGLVDELGESANMAMLDGQMVIYVGQAQSSHSMRMFTEVGRRAHMHDTGVGKAILAALPEQQVLSIVTSMGMPTPTVKCHGTVESLLADLEVIRERGYAVDDEEQEIGVRCFSMVLPNAPTPTAISVSGPTTRVDWGFGERAVPLLRDAAQRLSAQFASAR